MFFDWMYELGGQALVDIASNIILPFYYQICDMAASGDWIWQLFARSFEAILT